MENILANLRNGQNTDLNNGTIRNADAVLLLLHAAGGMAPVGRIKQALRTWRSGLLFEYLFKMPSGAGGYGFLGSNFDQSFNEVFHLPANPMMSDGHVSRRRTFYYRVRRGTIALSAEGMLRLAELGITA